MTITNLERCFHRKLRFLFLDQFLCSFILYFLKSEELPPSTPALQERVGTLAPWCSPTATHSGAPGGGIPRPVRPVSRRWEGCEPASFW